MDASKRRTQNERTSYTSLSVDPDDERCRRKSTRSISLPSCLSVFAVMTLFVGGGHIASHYPEFFRQAAQDLAPRTPPAALPAHSNPVPPIYTADALLEPKTLAECIKPDNIIDEAVATCRFGQFPRAVAQPVPQTMVAQSYTAKYNTEQPTTRTKRVVAPNIEKHTIWQWDGKRTYAAEWAVNDNRIEDNSVCANYRRGSVEYRECRKGAKVYFREKCREWGKRWEIDQAQSSKLTELRFCSAGDDFNPVG